MVRVFLLSISLLVLVGCDSQLERFEPNEVFARTLDHSQATPTTAAVADVSRVADDLFGTPDEPRWPGEWFDDRAMAQLVSLDRLQQAAGAVSSDRQGTNLGLYRKHCVNCHGVSGSGAGPASLFQNPYPRDFRHGVFKWKSTERTAKPTRDDLAALLRRGVADTGMPSFRLLGDEDINGLVDYVIYLSVRGEFERRLLLSAIVDLGYEEESPEQELRLWTESSESRGEEPAALIRRTLRRVAQDWVDADDRVVAVPKMKTALNDELVASIERGKGIFHGQVANCAGCHGPQGNGAVLTLDFDDWSKEYSTKLGITPTDRESLQPFLEVGALPPRQIRPRRLIDGVYRGGGDVETIYRQIAQGIAGTPMPSVQITEEPSDLSLTPDQVWDLVRYVKSLGPTGE